MLSNAYFLAKFRFDTAENEPAKNLQIFANFAPPIRSGPADAYAARAAADRRRSFGEAPTWHGEGLWF